MQGNMVGIRPGIDVDHRGSIASFGHAESFLSNQITVGVHSLDPKVVHAFGKFNPC